MNLVICSELDIIPDSVQSQTWILSLWQFVKNMTSFQIQNELNNMTLIKCINSNYFNMIFTQYNYCHVHQRVLQINLKYKHQILHTLLLKSLHDNGVKNFKSFNYTTKYFFGTVCAANCLLSLYLCMLWIKNNQLQYLLNILILKRFDHISVQY